MRKKILVGLSLVATLFSAVEALATKSRLTALGQSEDGSLYIRDSRNYLLNPAQVTQFADLVNLEAGTTSLNTTAPKAEGGLTYDLGGNVIGLQLGRVGQAARLISTQDSLASAFFLPQNSVELFWGSSAGWGASLHYANSKDDVPKSPTPANVVESSAQVVTGRAGLLRSSYEIYGSWDVIHKSQTKTVNTGATRKYDGELSLEFGGRTDLSDSAQVGGSVRRAGYKFDDGASNTGKYEATTIRADYFYYLSKSEQLTLFTSAGALWSVSKSSPDTAGTAEKKRDQLSLPLVVGLETPMNSWLSLRGSVSQAVLIHQIKTASSTDDRNTDNLDNTVVTLGFGAKFDKLSVDGSLAGTGPGVAAGNAGRLDGNNLVANLGLNYSF